MSEPVIKLTSTFSVHSLEAQCSQVCVCVLQSGPLLKLSSRARWRGRVGHYMAPPPEAQVACATPVRLSSAQAMSPQADARLLCPAVDSA